MGLRDSLGKPVRILLAADRRKAGKSMLHIAICDDEKEFVQYMIDLLNRYGQETGLDIKITPYYDGMELIEK